MASGLCEGGERPALRTYGRRRGHRLSARRERLMTELLPRLRVPPAVPGTLDPAMLFATRVREVWLEIGFGAGEHLVWQAEHHLDVGFLGAETFENGVATLLAAIEDHSLGNIRIHDEDGRDLLERLAPGSIGRAFILFPDPWPKARHNKRRLVSAATLDTLARVMKPAALLRVASDIATYQRWILEEVRRHGGFDWLASSAADWRIRPDDWPKTRYEAKAIAEGRRPVYLAFRRR